MKFNTAKELADYLINLSYPKLYNYISKLKNSMEEDQRKAFGIMIGGIWNNSNHGDEDKFSVKLIHHGPRKINVIKEIRNITGSGLKEAKDMSEAYNKYIIENVNRETAQKAFFALKGESADVEIDSCGFNFNEPLGSDEIKSSVTKTFVEELEDIDKDKEEDMSF